MTHITITGLLFDPFLYDVSYLDEGGVPDTDSNATASCYLKELFATREEAQIVWEARVLERIEACRIEIKKWEAVLKYAKIV